MSDILIKGLEMPKAKFGSMIVAIRPDGRVEDVMGCYVGKAVPVPKHGRLIDADDIENITVIINENGSGFNRIIAPTIIPASEEEMK